MIYHHSYQIIEYIATEIVVLVGVDYCLIPEVVINLVLDLQVEPVYIEVWQARANVSPQAGFNF
ncbi:hypothetical protein QQ020_16865 [Fulvivirgaceae bacterium BMA12]|uniref:Uncharacterized protein n=1 Tax=Agaribacillus aureus TaxID=3051825 RepID=A0ABT8L7L3_9BACT|nr:hypothetical protein [Fulvivirgaceae bacterium BMA12]